MSAATMDPDDEGTTRAAEVHCYTCDGVEYRSFPSGWDDEGRCMFACEKIDPQTGLSDFRITAFGDVNGCACRDCAPHEQNGPVAARWLADHGLIASRCTATTRHGSRCCNTNDGDPSGICGTHRYYAKRRREGVA